MWWKNACFVLNQHFRVGFYYASWLIQQSTGGNTACNSLIQQSTGGYTACDSLIQQSTGGYTACDSLSQC